MVKIPSGLAVQQLWKGQSAVGLLLPFGFCGSLGILLLPHLGFSVPG